MKTSLTEEQCYTIASFLRTAASRFDEFYKMMHKSPICIPMVEQFNKQEQEAKQFADLFERATAASLEVDSE